MTAVPRSLGLVVCALLLASAPAFADKADALFKKGKKLLAEKKYADACKTFEQVDQLDPGIGAKLNVARCYEEWGRVATAYRWYGDAEKMATDGSDDRAAKIQERKEELDRSVPRVTIKVPAGGDPAAVGKVTLDGAEVPASAFGQGQRVDPGPHVIEYTVGGVTKKKMAPVERGGSSEVMLEVPHPTTHEDPERHDRVPPPVEVSTPGRTQRIIGIGVGAAGVVTIGIAGFVTLSARSDYKAALTDHCAGSTSTCDPQGLTITHDARHRANTATVVTLVGTAAIAGGVVLYLLAPRQAESSEHALYLTPVVGADGAAFVFGGRY